MSESAALVAVGTWIDSRLQSPVRATISKGGEPRLHMRTSGPCALGVEAAESDARGLSFRPPQHLKVDSTCYLAENWQLSTLTNIFFPVVVKNDSVKDSRHFFKSL